MAVTVTVAQIRPLLGMYSGLWDDDELVDATVMVPARQALRGLCAGVDDFPPASEAEDVAEIALASLIAAQLLSVAPSIASTGMGDSSVSLHESAMGGRMLSLQDQARSMMLAVCPASAPPATVGIFVLAKGGRGR